MVHERRPFQERSVQAAGNTVIEEYPPGAEQAPDAHEIIRQPSFPTCSNMPTLTILSKPPGVAHFPIVTDFYPAAVVEACGSDSFD